MEELAVGVKAPESVREPDLHPRSVRPQNHWAPVHLDLGAHPASVLTTLPGSRYLIWVSVLLVVPG